MRALVCRNRLNFISLVQQVLLIYSLIYLNDRLTVKYFWKKADCETEYTVHHGQIIPMNLRGCSGTILGLFLLMKLRKCFYVKTHVLFDTADGCR